MWSHQEKKKTLSYSFWCCRCHTHTHIRYCTRRTTYKQNAGPHLTHPRRRRSPSRGLAGGLQLGLPHFQPAMAAPCQVSFFCRSAVCIIRHLLLQVPLRPDHRTEHRAWRRDPVPDVATGAPRRHVARGRPRLAQDGGVHGQHLLAHGARGHPVPRVEWSGSRVWGAGVPAEAGVCRVRDVGSGGIVAGVSSVVQM